MTDRRLATVENITEITPIADADAIELAHVRGWNVVVRKGEFSPRDLVVYLEVDSFLPIEDPRFAFLAARGVHTNELDVQGHVLKTARLRGQYSQGIVLPYALFPEVSGHTPGEDVTGFIAGLEKWDPPLPAELAGVARGNFPTRFHKSDEERVQNVEAFLDGALGVEWVATEKIDGTSITVYVDGDDYGVASRNLDLVENPENALWKA